MTEFYKDTWRTWNLLAAKLVTCFGATVFPEELMGALRTVIRCDVPSLILVFEDGVSPTAIHESEASADVVREVNDYLAGPYLLDPYYHAALEGAPSGAYRLRDIAPAGFRQSEFYRTYWRHTGIRDEIELLTRLSDRSFVMVSLLRKQLPPFTKKQLEFLNAAHPLIAQMIAQHWISRTRNTAPAALHADMQNVLIGFGADMLTLREQQVVQLLLRGYSTKSAARQLSVSPETVKLHRKHIFRKLQVASHVELFHAYIRSLGV